MNNRIKISIISFKIHLEIISKIEVDLINSTDLIKIVIPIKDRIFNNKIRANNYFKLLYKDTTRIIKEIGLVSHVKNHLQINMNFLIINKKFMVNKELIFKIINF